MHAERALFVRERSDGLYTSPTYLLYKAGEELLLGVAIALVVTPLVFYSLALSGSVLVFGAAYMMTIWNGIAMAYMVGDGGCALKPGLRRTGYRLQRTTGLACILA
jgi:hypothetical protein